MYPTFWFTGIGTHTYRVYDLAIKNLMQNFIEIPYDICIFNVDFTNPIVLFYRSKVYNKKFKNYVVFLFLTFQKDRQYDKEIFKTYIATW